MKKGSFSECIIIAWPLVLAMASSALMMFADRLFLARYSAVSIQAALPAGLVAFTVLAFLQSVVAYSGTFVAQYDGAGHRAATARAMGQGVWLAVLCVPILLATLPLGWFFFDLAGHAPAVASEEKSYYLTLVIANLAIPFVAALSGFFTGRGFTVLVMVANIIGNVTNVVLDPFFIWGWCGLPEMGIVGAGVATAIGQFLILAILAVAMFREPHLSSKQKRKVAFVWKTPLLLRIVGYGLPAGGHVLLDVLTFTIFVFITGRLDALSFSASNIALSINQLIFAPLLGIGMAATILVGQYQGAGDTDAAARSGRRCVLIGWMYITVVSIVLIVFAAPIIRLFYPHQAPFEFEAYRSLCTTLMIIFLAWAWIDAVNVILGGALKGAGDTRFVMLFVAGTELFLWMPILFWLYLKDFGIVALWLTMPGYVAVAGVGLGLRFIFGKWKKIKMV
ncbi:MAG: MATE family efflux transporter [Kiritimatiellia bacterium]